MQKLINVISAIVQSIIFNYKHNMYTYKLEKYELPVSACTYTDD